MPGLAGREDEISHGVVESADESAHVLQREVGDHVGMRAGGNGPFDEGKNLPTRIVDAEEARRRGVADGFEMPGQRVDRGGPGANGGADGVAHPHHPRDEST